MTTKAKKRTPPPRAEVGIRVLRRPDASAPAYMSGGDPEDDVDGGGPLFTIFNTLLDYPQALEAVRAELERKRQKIQLPPKDRSTLGV